MIMRSLNKMMIVAAGAVLILAAPVQQAEAKNGRNAALFGGLAAGAVLGGLIVGNGQAQAQPRQPEYVEEEVEYVRPPRCVNKRVWVEDEDGDRYRVTKRVCR